MRSLRLRRSALIAGIVLALLVPTAIASAGFLQSITASASLRGMIDLAQGPAEGDQHASPEDRRILAEPGDPAHGVVVTLFNEPTGDPGPGTASFPLTLQTMPGSAAATAQLRLQRPEGTPEHHWAALRFGFYAEGAPLLADGLPQTAEQIDAAGGVPLPRIEGNGASPLTVEVRVWISPRPPRDIYATAVAMDLDVLGETAAGERFRTEVKYS
jgi:hypothetical protein